MKKENRKQLIGRKTQVSKKGRDLDFKLGLLSNHPGHAVVKETKITRVCFTRKYYFTILVTVL